MSITLTMTTCRRLPLFIRTVAAFMRNCADFDLISRVIVVDDRSDSADRRIMKEAFPEFEFLYTEGGHVVALNMLFSHLRTPHFFHLQDDWQLIKKLPLIRASLDVLREGSVDTFSSGWYIGYATDRREWISSRAVRYYRHKFNDDGRFWSNYSLGNTSWPGFSLAPALHTTDVIKAVPYRDVRCHERAFSADQQRAGLRIAFNCGDVLFRHIGEESAYDITGTPR